MGKMTAVDLFCGCGGLSLGLKLAGFNVIGSIDVDPLAVETYKQNHIETVVWRRDIRKVSVRRWMDRLGLKEGELDLLAGCPPCQGFSSMRTLNGGREIEDDRNNLVLQFIRFAKWFRPKVIMMENVPGLTKDRRFKRLKRVLRRMGYECKVKVVDTADYQVPQRRQRMILIASSVGRVRFARRSSIKKSVRDFIEGLPNAGESGDPLHDYPEQRTEQVMERIRQIPPDGGSRNALPDGLILECHRRLPGGFRDVYGRMTWDDVAPTITGGCTNPSKGRFLHPIHNRAITMREAALLQTFPPDYQFSLRRGKGAVSVMIGNALPPEFIRRHAISITRILPDCRKER
jgi:DNA (cytosine-5)-methyltransferase 1